MIADRYFFDKGEKTTAAHTNTTEIMVQFVSKATPEEKSS
jgi:hypothetical protein